MHVRLYVSILFTFSGVKNFEQTLPELVKFDRCFLKTATANVETRKCVIKNLEMQSCYVLTKNPNMLNIRYGVSIKPSDPVSIVQPFITSMQSGLTTDDKYLIFCTTYNDTNMIYELIALELAKCGALFLPDNHPEVAL